MDISFSEILLVLLVALLVIKPEHLPQAATSLGRFLKSLRVWKEKFKQELEKPFDLLTDSHKKTDEA